MGCGLGIQYGGVDLVFDVEDENGCFLLEDSEGELCPMKLSLATRGVLDGARLRSDDSPNLTFGATSEA